MFLLSINCIYLSIVINNIKTWFITTMAIVSFLPANQAKLLSDLLDVIK